MELTKILSWIETARQAMERNTIAAFPDCEPNHYTLKFKKGKKYFKLIASRLNDESGGGSAYAFIDFEGNIYKASSWSKPAKGIRATIESADAEKITTSTGWLYR